MSISSPSLRVSASAATAWAALKGADLTFIHPRVRALLKTPPVPEATEEKAKPIASEWFKPGSVRSISLIDGIDSNAVRTAVNEPAVPLFFDQVIKLTQLDDATMTVKYDIIEPSTISVTPTIRSAITGLGDDVSSVVVPSNFTFKVDGDTKCADVTVETSFAKEPTASDKTFSDAYVQFLLDSLKAALTGPYPHTPRRGVLEDFHGTSVYDSYRWEEDPDSPDTQAWVAAQNLVTEKVLAACPDREKILTKLLDMYQFERYSRPSKAGPYYYYYKNDGLQNQSVQWQTKTLSDPGRVFLDPTDIDSEGTAAIGANSFSKQGKWYAYGVARNGSDWNTIYIRNTDTLKDLSDELHWVRFSSISWTHDDKGFFYSRYPAPSKLLGEDIGKRGTETDAAGNQSIYYHVVGTSQDEDLFIYSDPANPKWLIQAYVTDDGKYLGLEINDSCDPVNRLFIAPLEGLSDALDRKKAGTLDNKTPALRVNKLIDNFEAMYSYITNIGSKFYFLTNLKAPRYRVITIDVSTAGETAPAVLNVEEVIPEPPNQEVLSSAGACYGKILVKQNIDVCDYLKLYNLDGTEEKSFSVDLPKYSSIGFGSEHDEPELFIQCTSMLHAGISYVVDMRTGKAEVFRMSQPKGFVADEFEVKQVFYPSTDGTNIPMFITHKKSLKLDGNNPAYLYAYGGFNITIGPSFSVNRWLYMQHFNGVVAIANLRGGGEYGENWHKSGALSNKQRVFDDFHSASRYLTRHGYANPGRIACHGGSNGGLLVAACVNQQPKLFGAAVAAVGVLDMLRFHKFTIGYAWCSEYGNAEENKADFENMYKYSPLHNVGHEYPALMLTTADHDDRVVPLHSLKYISQVQRVVGASKHQSLDANPVVIRVETKAGHGAGKSLKKQMSETADVFGFFAKHTGAKWTD